MQDWSNTIANMEFYFKSLWPSDAIYMATWPWINIGLGHGLLPAWRQQAITWTNADFSLLRFGGIHLRTILYFQNYCHISQGQMS